MVWLYQSRAQVLITLKTIRPKNLGSLLIKWSQSNFNKRSPDSNLVPCYLITCLHFGTFGLEGPKRPQNYQNEIKKSKKGVFTSIKC